MNKRERKKFRKGEYLELGFSIGICFVSNIEAEMIDKFYFDFEAMLDTHKLCCGGGFNYIKKTFGMFIRSDLTRGKSKKHYLSVTPEQWQVVSVWCHARAEVYKLKIGKLADVWRKTTKKEDEMTFEDEMVGAEVLREDAQAVSPQSQATPIAAVAFPR